MVKVVIKEEEEGGKSPSLSKSSRTGEDSAKILNSLNVTFYRLRFSFRIDSGTAKSKGRTTLVTSPQFPRREECSVFSMTWTHRFVVFSSFSTKILLQIQKVIKK